MGIKFFLVSVKNNGPAGPLFFTQWFGRGLGHGGIQSVEVSRHGARRLWVGEGLRRVVVGQSIEGEAAHGKGNGDPALATVGASAV